MTLPPLPTGLRAALAMFVMDEQRKALETGFVKSCSNSIRYKDLGRSIRRYAAVAVLAEREACAKLCETRYMGDNNREDMEARACAAAIRARGE